MTELIEKHGTEQSAEIAGVFAMRGENDRAFEWLERALANNESSLGNLASQYSFGNLHEDSRWQPFLARLGQSEAQLVTIKFDVQLPE